MIKIHDITLAQDGVQQRLVPVQEAHIYLDKIATGGVSAVSCGSGLMTPSSRHMASMLASATSLMVTGVIDMSYDSIAMASQTLGTIHAQLQIRYDGHDLTFEDAAKRIDKYMREARRVGFTDIALMFDDAFALDRGLFLDLSHQAVSSGASCVIMGDVHSIAVPKTVEKRVWALRQSLPQGSEIGIQCHNGLGLATANTMAACESGARLLQAVMPCVQEQTGLASIVDLITILQQVYPQVPTMPMDREYMVSADELLSYTMSRQKTIGR